MSQENVDLVRIAYDVAWPQRSVEGFQEHFADDFTWRQRPEWPGRSVYGRDEMPKLWADLDATFAEYTLTAVEYADAGDYVIVTVEDGLVVEACVYSTRQEALEAAGVPVT